MELWSVAAMDFEEVRAAVAAYPATRLIEANGGGQGRSWGIPLDHSAVGGQAARRANLQSAMRS